jgi:hypothetical protein
MKKIMRSIFVFIVVILLSSCTIQKRVHNRGWSIEWNRSYQTIKEKSEDTQLHKNVYPTTTSSELNKDSILSKRVTKKIAVPQLLRSEKNSSKSIIPIQKNKLIDDHRIKATGKIQEEDFVKYYKQRNSESDKHVSDKKIKRDINWELFGAIGLGIVVVAIVGLALFGKGTLALIASILLSIGYLALIIAAVVCICWFLWFVFFGWMG